MNALTAPVPDLSLEFGLFTPKQVCAIIELCKPVMAPDGVLLVNDYLGCDLPGGASSDTQEHVWKRLHFDYLHGHIAWRHIVEDAGVDVIFYEMLKRIPMSKRVEPCASYGPLP